MEQSSHLTLLTDQGSTPERPGEIRARLRALIESGELKLQDLERFTTHSAAIIGQYLSGKSIGDEQNVENAIARFYRNYITKKAFIQTRIADEIHAVMTLAWMRKEIALIQGKFGRGKSKAASRFVSLHDYAVFVELTGISSPREVLHRVADGLNIGFQMNGTSSDKLHAIIRSLQRTPKLIVVDEADELRPKTLAIMRDIFGEKSERCGIVLIATQRFNNLLENPELGYLRRRITIKREIGEISPSEARAVCDLWPHRLDSVDIKKAWNWSVRHFGVASLVNLMMRSYDEMQFKDKRRIDRECLEAAYHWVIE